MPALAVVLPAGALVAVVLLGVSGQRLARLATDPFVPYALPAGLPARLQASVTELTSLKFRVVHQHEVTMVSMDLRLAQVLLLDSSETILAQAVCGYADHHPPPGIGFSSLLAGSRAKLETERVHRLPLGPHGFHQVFPTASCDVLLAEHRAGLDVMGAMGLTPDRIVDPVATAARLIELTADGFRTAPVRARLVAGWRQAWSRDGDLGPISGRSSAMRRLQALVDDLAVPPGG